MPNDPPPSDPSLYGATQPYEICKERARLLHRYAAAAKTYADCVREISELVVSGREGVNEARTNCRAAWDETEKSRLELYRHESDHQCDRGARVPSVSDL